LISRLAGGIPFRYGQTASEMPHIQGREFSAQKNALRYAWKLSTGVSCRKNRG